MSMTTKYLFNRDVTQQECPWLSRDFKKDEIVYGYSGHTYGCITDDGTAVTVEPNKTPFFEVPNDSIDVVKNLKNKKP